MAVILAVTAAAATAAAVGRVPGPAMGCRASGGVMAYKTKQCMGTRVQNCGNTF